MLEYQKLITAAFQDYPVEACIEYDRCFRQLAVKDRKSPGISTKTETYLFCFSPKSASAGLGNATETHNYFQYNKTTHSVTP